MRCQNEQSMLWENNGTYCSLDQRNFLWTDVPAERLKAVGLLEAMDIRDLQPSLVQGCPGPGPWCVMPGPECMISGIVCSDNCLSGASPAEAGL